MRGFRTNEFGGDAIIYHAFDLRVRLVQSKGTFPISMGVFESFDFGRVWHDEQNKTESKRLISFGGSILLIPLFAIGFKFGYFIGEDDRQSLIGGSLHFRFVSFA